MAAEAKSGFPRHPSLDRPYYIKGEIDRLAMDMRLENDTLRTHIARVLGAVYQNSEKIKKINERMVQFKAKALAQSMAGGRKRKRKKGRRTKKRKSRKRRTKRRKKRTKRRR